MAEAVIERRAGMRESINYDVLPEYRQRGEDWWIDGTLPPLSREEALVRLRELARVETSPEGHNYADDILTRYLRSLGESELADAFATVGKWYD